MDSPFKTDVIETQNGFQVKFTIDNQTFFLQEQLPDHLSPSEKITLKEYSEWYEQQLDIALTKLYSYGKNSK